jgi:hypothetical protein
LERGGFVVLRFWNNDVLTHLGGVLTVIAETLAERCPPHPARKSAPSSSPRGERRTERLTGVEQE